MCLSNSRPAPPPPPPPPPAPPPMLEQIAPVRADRAVKKSETKSKAAGNKDYRYTPDSAGHVTSGGAHTLAGIKKTK